MSFFEKPKNQENPNQEILYDESSLLVLNNRQLSCIAAGLIALFFFVFMGGYFLGQKKALERFSSQIDQDSLSDKIATSLYSMYDTTNEDEYAETSDASEVTDVSEGEDSSDPQPPLLDSQKEPENVKAADADNKASVKNYYAELSGFGSEKTALDFSARLHKKGVRSMIKKLTSRSSKGNSVPWYQVVTANYESYETLVDVVAKLKREEHLKNVRIVTC